MEVDVTAASVSPTAATMASRPRRRRFARPFQSEADRRLAHEAHGTRWLCALGENDGLVIDQVKLLEEQAMLAGIEAPPSPPPPPPPSSSMTTTSKDVVESVCSACGYLPEWNVSRAVAAEDILSTQIVAATRFHSIQCAELYYQVALSSEDKVHLLDATLDRIRGAFSALEAPPLRGRRQSIDLMRSEAACVADADMATPME